MNKRILAAGALALAAVAAPLCLHGQQLGTDDGANAKLLKVDNMHRTRYIEVFVVQGDPASKQLRGICYNTMFCAAGIPASKDTAPQALVEAFDPAKVKKEFGALGVGFNGPKLWMPDWTDINAGVERDFNGLKAAWCADLQMKSPKFENPPYVQQKIARKSALGYRKGTTVFLIDDADGNTWIMKGFQQGLKPSYTYEEFLATGASRFKNLPKGSKFRTKVLEKDLTLIPKSGVATIMPDEFFNVYDKTGPGYSDYKP